jgi:hypothetical protein
MGTEVSTTYYVLREFDEPQATGPFRPRCIRGRAWFLEHVDRRGCWVLNNDLIRYFLSEMAEAVKISEVEAVRIARRLGASLEEQPLRAGPIP